MPINKAYNIEFRSKVLKVLVKINEPYYSAIKKHIYELDQDPIPKGYKKLKGRPGYRIRIGDYRFIYKIFDDILLIDVVDLGHQKDIY